MKKVYLFSVFFILVLVIITLTAQHRNDTQYFLRINNFWKQQNPNELFVNIVEKIFWRNFFEIVGKSHRQIRIIATENQIREWGGYRDNEPIPDVIERDRNSNFYNYYLIGSLEYDYLDSLHWDIRILKREGNSRGADNVGSIKRTIIYDYNFIDNKMKEVAIKLVEHLLNPKHEQQTRFYNK